MTDMRVRQQDRVGKAAQQIDLARKIRRRVDHEAAAGGMVDEAERRDELTLRGVAARFDAQGLPATEVGHSTVLGDPENDGLDISSVIPSDISSVIPSEARDPSDVRSSG